MPLATQHYLSDEVDPLFIHGSRDHLQPFIRPGRILNMGLGYGTWDEVLTGRDDDVTGLDLDPDLIAHFGAKYADIEYVCADATTWTPDAPFDTIIGSHFLEHLDEPVAALQRWRGWLAPGGRIMIVVPNADSLHRRIGKSMGMLEEVTDLNDSDHRLGHRRVYTRSLLRQHIEEAGLEIVHFTGVGMKPFSNAQLAELPAAYLDAVVGFIGPDVEPVAVQLVAVLEA